MPDFIENSGDEDKGRRWRHDWLTQVISNSNYHEFLNSGKEFLFELADFEQISLGTDPKR